jgi:hypothetical protein
MSDASVTYGRLPPDILRRLWPKGTAKHVARRFDVAWNTARKWLVDGAPLARRQQLADAIEIELARIEREAEELRAARDLLRESNANTDSAADAGGRAAVALARKIAEWGRS